MFECIKNLFKKKEPIVFASIFLKEWLKIKYPKLAVSFDDELYVMPTDEEIAHALYMTFPDKSKYVPESNDCDEFAKRFVSNFKGTKGWAVCYVKANKGKHALAAVISNDLKIHYIEPQTLQEVDCEPVVMEF